MAKDFIRKSFRDIDTCWFTDSSTEFPVLILIGSADKLLCAGDNEKLPQRLPREQLETIEESGHCLVLDSPDVVSRNIVTFTRGGME
jgi:pimeloyl-ACP methyl ester carboxylesterase